MLYPLKFKSVYKELVWGGSKLRAYFGRDIKSDHIGESWDVVSHPNGMSIVENGPLSGTSLEKIYDEYKEELLGERYNQYNKFPLLVKIIDANQNLSVQVHPDDHYAFTHEGGELGKNEMWYIIDAKAEAKLIVGLKEGVTKASFKAAIESGHTEELLNVLPIKKGDVINIPAGLVHAICEGVMLAEIQQNSDTTYRIYDWNRIGLDGNPRELHVEKSLDVIDFTGKLETGIVTGATVYNNNTTITKYISNKYFIVDTVDVFDSYKTSTLNSMHIYTLIEGYMTLRSEGHELILKMGDSILVPACVLDHELVGNGLLLRAKLPI